ncbi:hypothetical protein [Silicimonas sp. MF1-12-2]|uniref:hypothetical protein n=1 Tax=Silicimonas sp. MF1-12-2 TaxID=3384793 RepID=UPI0039B479F0
MMKSKRKISPTPTWGRGFKGISGLVSDGTSRRWYKANSQLLAVSLYARQHP